MVRCGALQRGGDWAGTKGALMRETMENESTVLGSHADAAESPIGVETAR